MIDKIAVVGTGYLGLHGKHVVELDGKGVEIADYGIDEDDYLKRFQSFQISDLAEREAEKTQQEIFKLQNIRKPATISNEVYKPTCKKHHEYVQHIYDNGVEYKSMWKCRFCDKSI